MDDNKAINDMVFEYTGDQPMDSSKELDKVFTAFSKMQGSLEGASKDSTNPFFKSKYADLKSIWGVARKPLADNGLSVMQTMACVNERTVLQTRLCHSSGQWIQGCQPLNPTKNDPQGVGSAITYARRYGLAAMLGIIQEDDDGEAAQGRSRQAPPPRNRQARDSSF